MTYRQEADWEALPQSERAALQALVELAGDGEQARTLANGIAAERRRRARKARLNAVSDRQARVLVGARLPREEAQAVAREAHRRGQSVYRFVRETLYREVNWRF